MRIAFLGNGSAISEFAVFGYGLQLFAPLLTKCSSRF